MEEDSWKEVKKAVFKLSNHTKKLQEMKYCYTKFAALPEQECQGSFGISFCMPETYLNTMWMLNYIEFAHQQVRNILKKKVPSIIKKQNVSVNQFAFPSLQVTFFLAVN